MHLYIGIDWSEEKHDVAFVNEKGALVQQFTIAHTESGFKQLDRRRQKLAVDKSECTIGLETAHTLLIDHLWTTGYDDLYVIAPNVVNKNRGRYRQSDAKDDKWDAYVIGDLVRTDRKHYQPWRPGTTLLQQLRTSVRFHLHLTKQTTANANRLRALLLRYYPVAYHLFPSWPSMTSCRFILQYPTPAQAKAICAEELQEFLHQAKYPRRNRWLDFYQRLHADYAPPADGAAAAYPAEATWLAQTLLSALQVKQQNLATLRSLFEQHPDAPIFHSLPGVGDFLAPALLVKFGEDRERFPSPAAAQALAGTCPVTKQSGKARSVRFRRACDREFRHIAQLHARSSLRSSEWASTYYDSILSRKPSRNHALRCVANRWLKVLWTLWQRQTPYDESRHLQQIARHRTR